MYNMIIKTSNLLAHVCVGFFTNRQPFRMLEAPRRRSSPRFRTVFAPAPRSPRGLPVVARCL